MSPINDGATATRGSPDCRYRELPKNCAFSHIDPSHASLRLPACKVFGAEDYSITGLLVRREDCGWSRQKETSRRVQQTVSMPLSPGRFIAAPATGVPAVNEIETVAAIRQGLPLPPQTVMEWRSAGMHKVRLEFIKRLLRLDVRIITLSIYWEDGRNIAQLPTLQKTPLKLVYATKPRVSGKFDDANMLCYVHDAASRAAIDAEIDRMVTVIENFLQQSAAL